MLETVENREGIDMNEHKNSRSYVYSPLPNVIVEEEYSVNSQESKKSAENNVNQQKQP